MMATASTSTASRQVRISRKRSISPVPPCSGDGVPDVEELRRLRHVVHADDRGALPRGPGDGREAAAQPAVGRRHPAGVDGRAREKALAAGAQQQRPAESPRARPGGGSAPGSAPRSCRSRSRDRGRAAPRPPPRLTRPPGGGGQLRRAPRPAGRRSGSPAAWWRARRGCASAPAGSRPRPPPRPSRGSARAVTSLIRSAPAARACRATSPLRVSTESGASVAARRAASTGRSRALSSSAGTVRAPPP